MSDTPRCEPPPELRGVDGWHWINHDARGQKIQQWVIGPAIPGWRAGSWFYLPEELDSGGWRYVAPVSTPAEVEALRAERDAATARTSAACANAVEAYDEVAAERDTLRATVAGLVEELQECANDLGEYVAARYASTEHHPSEARRKERDMEPVIRARLAIARAKGDGT